MRLKRIRKDVYSMLILLTTAMFIMIFVNTMTYKIVGVSATFALIITNLMVTELKRAGM